MENKNLIYIVGGLAVVGIGYYLYTKRKSATPQQAPININVKDADATAEETEPKATPIGKPKNPMQKDQLKEIKNQVPLEDRTKNIEMPKPKPKTQLTKNEVEFRLLKKCGVKPLLNIKGSVQKYENCKNAFKDDLRSQGLISFSGDRYSNMSNDFDISFR